MNKRSILVTGGAGYIGSHVVRQLAEAGERIVVLDNLGKGFRQAVIGAQLVVGEVGDAALVSKLLADHEVDTVMHFAAHTIVPESVALPLKYYGNNTCSSRTLLQACLDHRVEHFVFSSTAAVYGIPEEGYASEESPTRPINAYGTSKLMTEWMLRDVAAVNPLRYVALRYFNVAGSDPSGRIGQTTPGATLLTKVACEAMVGKRAHLSIFGTDYPTPDGTGVRDYLHIEDWPRRICGRSPTSGPAAADHPERGLWPWVFGARSARHGRIGGRQEARDPRGAAPRRRPGLPGGAGERIRAELGWEPRYDDLQAIVSSSLAWERKLQREPWS